MLPPIAVMRSGTIVFITNDANTSAAAIHPTATNSTAPVMRPAYGAARARG
jgi:hypothetical protein